VLKKLFILLEMIKFEHTVFALPFAFLGAVFAAHGLPSLRQAGWILIAMVGARSAAMAFNRLIDLPFDAQNPRTAGRALPQGLLGISFVAAFIAASSALLILAAWQLNPLAFKLSPAALAIVFFYSCTKRFTWGSHLFLGVSLACSPIGAWIAVRGDLGATPLILGAAVVLWVAGFDIIYSCQDLDFDRRSSLQSIPKRFGLIGALWISGLMHVLMVALLTFLFLRQDLGWLSYAGLAAVATMLIYEHALVRPSDLSRVNAAFFTINGWISILLLITTSMDIIIHTGS
jgi:4-hydroxybenzoate polyprenyltransferase